MTTRTPDNQVLEQGFELGPLRIEPRAGEVSGPGGREKLEPKVMAVLVMLARHAGQVVQREDLLRKLWPDAAASDDVLSRCIYELRRQLSRAGDDEQLKALVETVPKRGYRLHGNVTPIVEKPAAQPPHRVNWVVLAAIAGVAAALLGWLYVGRDTAGPAADPAITAADTAISIAVLPFADMSENQDHGYFADGISEEILERLARSGELKVIARTSSFLFRGDTVDIPEIAARLGVSHLLEGSVRIAGDRIRITAQLIEASSNSHVWSETYDREMGDLFAVQDQIATAIARRLDVSLAGGSPSERRPSSTEAYENFLQGEFFYKRRAPGDIERSVRYYEQAVEMDPGYARAWAALSGAYGLMWLEAGKDRAEWLERQGMAARKAVELDPQLAVAHSRLARFYYASQDPVRGDQHGIRAEALDPDDPLVMGFTIEWTARSGKLDTAIAMQQRLAARDPLSFLQRSILGMFLLAAGRLDEALSELRASQELNREMPAVGLRIAQILALQGRHEEALAVIEGLPAGTIRDLGIAMLYRAPGMLEAADQALERLSAQPGDDMQETIWIAEVFAARGMDEVALARLQALRASIERDREAVRPTMWQFHSELLLSHLLKPLRADPRWVALTAALP